MSFLDTLKNLGLWQPQQAEQPNPYGLDPALMKQARMSALGNVGGQLLAMSQQMTQDQRARMMANADWSGGYQGNLQNMAQMQIMGQAQQEKTLERERREKARGLIADMIKKAPPGQARNAAMYFFEAGDLSKAGEILFKQERRFNPYTATYETVDAFGQPVGGGRPPAAPSPGGAAMPVQTTLLPGPQVVPAPSPGASPIPAPDSTGVMPEAPVDQMTVNWRRLTGDPNLTPGEAQQIAMAAAAENDPAAGLKVYRELQTQKRIGTKDQSEMANTVLDDRTAEIAEPQKVVQFAQSIEDTLASGNPTSMRALATQVLFAKVLDPGSAFMTGEAELQQAAASWSQRVSKFLSSTTEGTPIPAELVLEMRDISRQLGRKALQKMEQVDRRTKTRADAFGITQDMLGGAFPLRWNRFADPVVSEEGTGRREPSAMDDLTRYGG